MPSRGTICTQRLPYLEVEGAVHTILFRAKDRRQVLSHGFALGREGVSMPRIPDSQGPRNSPEEDQMVSIVENVVSSGSKTPTTLSSLARNKRGHLLH
jgi:hypothetical protein